MGYKAASGGQPLKKGASFCLSLFLLIRLLSDNKDKHPGGVPRDVAAACRWRSCPWHLPWGPTPSPGIPLSTAKNHLSKYLPTSAEYFPEEIQQADEIKDSKKETISWQCNSKPRDLWRRKEPR